MYKNSKALLLTLGIFSLPLQSADIKTMSSLQKGGVALAACALIGSGAYYYLKPRKPIIVKALFPTKIKPEQVPGLEENECYNQIHGDACGRLNAILALASNNSKVAQHVSLPCYANCVSALICQVAKASKQDIAIALSKDLTQHTLLKAGTHYYLNNNNELLYDPKSSSASALEPVQINLIPNLAMAIKNADKLQYGQTWFELSNATGEDPHYIINPDDLSNAQYVLHIQHFMPKK